jgi:hypothetical protein
MEYLTAHWKEILLIATSLVTAFSVISRLTPNTMDDKVAAKLLRILSLGSRPPADA